VVVVVWVVVADATNCRVEFIGLLLLVLMLAIVCFVPPSPSLAIGIYHCGSFVGYVPWGIQIVLPMFLSSCWCLHCIVPE